MKVYSETEHINVGSGTDVTIAELASVIADVVGYDGRIAYDASKPDGTPRKLMSGDKLAALGWRPKISLRDGLADTYRAVPRDELGSILNGQILRDHQRSAPHERARR